MVVLPVHRSYHRSSDPYNEKAGPISAIHPKLFPMAVLMLMIVLTMMIG